jgi:hypothetical protein
VEISAAIPLLVELLAHSKEGIRAAAASALAKIPKNGVLHLDLTV